MSAGADAGGQAGEATEEPSGRSSMVHGVAVTESSGMRVLHPDREQLLDLVRALRDEDGFIMCLDVCGVDYLTYRAPRRLPDGVAEERFEVVITLISHATAERVQVKVQVPEDDPSCPSLFEIHPGSEASERETFDMFGIRFDGHPDLTRILMPEDWEGHPLRKDYAQAEIPVQFKAASNER